MRCVLRFECILAGTQHNNKPVHVCLLYFAGLALVFNLKYIYNQFLIITLSLSLCKDFALPLFWLCVFVTLRGACTSSRVPADHAVFVCFCICTVYTLQAAPQRTRPVFGRLFIEEPRVEHVTQVVCFESVLGTS